ncbi:MAG: sugar ABC transporter substrate-binding protein [Armatimonadetes bacterium]|nr:sugar ABC transporter substrate-binding protein [Armatimonadota bacterium]
MMDRFERSNPDLRLEWVDVPINVVMPKLMASIAGGMAPDVVNLNSEFAMILAQNNALVDVDRAVPAKVRAAYFEGLWNAARFEGKNYAIPWYVSTSVVMINTGIFRKAGLDPARAPRTLEELAEFARIIRRETGLYGYMPAIKLLEDWQLNGIPILSEDRKHALFASPPAAARLDWYVSLYKEDTIPKETLIQGYQGALDRYKDGSLGMLVAGPQFLLKIRQDAPEVYENTVIAPLPRGRLGIVPAATMNLVVPKACRKREKAVKWALFLTNDENQLAFCKEVPLLPSVRKAAKDPFFLGGTGRPVEDAAIRVSIAQLPHARDLNLGLKQSQELGRALKEALESAMYGRMSSKEAIERASRKWNEVLRR